MKDEQDLTSYKETRTITGRRSSEERRGDSDEEAKFSLLVLFIIFWLLDTVATCVFVSKLGVELEANPLMVYIITATSLSGFCTVKLLTAVPYTLIYKHVPVWISVIITGLVGAAAGVGVVLALQSMGVMQ